MNRFAAIAAALVPSVFLQPSVTAQDAASFQDKIDAANGIIMHWEHTAQGVAQELNHFGIKLPQTVTHPQAPQPPTNGDTAVSCESALLFDADNSSLVYVGNVFLQDARLNLFARNRLFIRMETGISDDKKATKEEKKPSASPVKQTTDAASQETPTEQITVKQETRRDINLGGAAITTHDAVVNALDNCIILSSPKGEDPIHLKSGENELWIRTSAEHPARLLADAEGNILLSGAEISMKWVDEQGNISTLQAHNGVIYYHAADATLTIPAGGTLTHPDGCISCTKELTAQLRKAPTAEPKKDGFMQQFAGMKFDGIQSATACGNVHALTAGTQGSMPAKLSGDKLVYDGNTGACSLYGTSCEAEYGKNTLCCNEALLLHPNGDLELIGTDIHGSYERPANDKTAAPLAGTFKANAPIIFRAATGQVTTDKGLQAKDAENDFSCTGPVVIQLAKAADAKESKTPAPGMPNLAIADYREIISVSAEGAVTAHQFDAKSRARIGMVRAQTLRSNLTTGETTLEGTSTIPAIAEHNGNTLEAQPGKTTPLLHLAANGDIKLTGDTINAEFQTSDGKSSATCKDYILLTRATNKLETGSGAVMKSPQGIFTTNKSLVATLLPKQDAKPATGKLAHLRFQYSGIKEAYTAAGGTMRTPQGSMQCNGPIRLIMDDAQHAKDNELAGIRKATAAGNVALAGKDSSGRILKAMGDYLDVDASTGMKRLTGSRVILADKNNTHIASGKNAAIVIDAKNNTRISGEHHTTVATNIHEQMNKQKSNQR